MPALAALPPKKSNEGIINWMLRTGAGNRLDDIPSQDKSRKLDGWDKHWHPWLIDTFPHVASKPLASRHTRLWEWFDGLEPGVKPTPYIALWPRGGGKSSTIELACARLCVTLKRRFVLILSGTQDQAVKHVQSIASLLEMMGVERQLNPYGHSKGWRQNQLRTANGFNVAAIGREVAVRGIKLDHFRPDLIIPDDIDNALDSPEEIQKTIDLLTKSILPAGSPDCAVCFVQNVVHSGSIANKFVNRTAGFLIGAHVDGPEPAVIGLTYEKESDSVDENGEQVDGRYRITGGEATWEGQPLETCEEQLNEWGPDAFETEAQHNLKFASLFFPDYDKETHLKPAIYLPDTKDEKVRLPHWFKFFAGLDWGYSDPYAWVLCCVDETRRIHVLECMKQRRLLNEEQARLLKDAMTRWGIPIHACPVTYDPSMDNEKTFNGMKADPDIKKYMEAGFNLRPADSRADSTQHGWNKVREILKKPNGIVFYRGYASAIADAVQDAKPDKLNREELDDHDDHLNHALLYALTGEYGLAEPPESESSKKKKARGRMLRLAEYNTGRGNRQMGRDFV